MSLKTNVVQQQFIQLQLPTLVDLTDPDGVLLLIKAINDALLQVQQASLNNLAAVQKTLKSDSVVDVTLFVAATSGGAVTTPLRIKNGVPVTAGFTAPTNAPPGNNALTVIKSSGHPTRVYP